jgi:RNA polymerase sigma-70 factor (ECF subfamily)
VTIRPIQHSDEELLRRIHAGDEQAFTTFYRSLQGPAYRFALHMSGSHSIAEDVTQEAFMTLLDARCGFQPDRGTLKAYLFGVVRNLVRRRVDRESPYVELTEPSQDAAALHGTNGNYGHQFGAERAEAIAEVRQAVLRLPADYREAVVLCDLQELSYEEAAAALGAPIGTIRSRLHRGRALLAQKLRPSRPEQTVAEESAR